MLAGAWILVLLPLMDVLQAFKWASRVPVPTVFDFRGTVRTLDNTLVCFPGVYAPLVFCIGVVLLFSKERGRRRGRLDWTRRWGIICTYAVFLLCATGFLFITALVLVGIAAIFQSMPLKYQPEVTQLLVDVSTAYLRYGAQPMDAAAVVLVAFSSIAVLLACVPLFEALRSSGLKRLGAILLAPLVGFSLMHLVQAGWYGLGFSGLNAIDVYTLATYFRPRLLVGQSVDWNGWITSEPPLSAVLVEAAKWCSIVGIAACLSIAQLATRWKDNERSAVAVRDC